MVELIRQAVQRGHRVLVTAPSNVAVDNVLARLAPSKLRLVRLGHPARLQTDILPYSLEALVQKADGTEIVRDVRQELAALFRQQQRYRNRREIRLLQKEVATRERRVVHDLLQNAQVVLSTCVGAATRLLAQMSFDMVVIDEAAQALEAACWIPALKGKRLVLAGDHWQLPPTILCKDPQVQSALSQTMFERVMSATPEWSRMLQVQYRMHPALSEFPSNMFYEGSLQNGVTEADRQLLTTPGYSGKEDFPWPVPGKPMFFYSIMGMEEISASGTSYLNRTEASYVEKIVTHLLRMGVTPSQIGVITPYDGQKKYVFEHMRRAGALAGALYEAIEVASVDAFQGREKDFILVSCVRSSESQGIGFLSDPRRLNVALTRARLGIILLGNPRVLSKNPLWAALLLHFKEYDCLVEGTLNNLQPSYMTFARPRKNLASDSRYAFTALARGGWDGRWDDRRDRPHNAPGFRSRGSRGKEKQTDSRFDPRYESSTYESYENGRETSSGLPIPSFAPLPSYAGGDDLSVGADSAYDSQYGGSRASLYSQRKDRGPSLGYYVGGTGGNFYSNGK